MNFEEKIVLAIEYIIISRHLIGSIGTYVQDFNEHTEWMEKISDYYKERVPINMLMTAEEHTKEIIEYTLNDTRLSLIISETSWKVPSESLVKGYRELINKLLHESDYRSLTIYKIFNRENIIDYLLDK